MLDNLENSITFTFYDIFYLHMQNGGDTKLCNEEEITIEKEQFKEMFRDVDTFRRQQQRKGLCNQHSHFPLACSMDCAMCKHKVGFEHESLDCITYEKQETKIHNYISSYSFNLDCEGQYAELYEAIYKLTDEEKIIVYTVMYDEKDKESAKKLNIPVSTYSSRKRKLIEKLKVELAEYYS